MNIRVGCCGFSEAHHKYFTHFDLVEIQSTFYQPPRCSTATKWRQSAPENFEFTLKAWQLITHKPSSPTYRRLKEPLPQKKKPKYGFFKPTKEVFSAWEVTKEFAVALEVKFILFQCPASFRSTEENIENLKTFFKTIDRVPFRLVWEPRGPWAPDLIKDICQELDLIHSVDPLRSESFSDSFKYYRLHGLTGYRYKYTDEDLLKLKEICCQSENVYCLFNNIAMKDDALRFKKLINS
ncbi:MAG: DUF72 domain-containing protein [bacterium]